MATYFSWSRDTPPEGPKHYNPRGVPRMLAWLHEINKNPDLPAKLEIGGHLPMDQYIYGLEYLILELHDRVQALEAKHDAAE